MFHSDKSLPAPLDASCYSGEAAYVNDVTRLRARGWQLVATTGMLAKPGDYFATERLGVPLVIRNHDGQYVAFRNVCAHRSCRIAKPGKGHTEQIKCPFHGWHYGADGRTRKIPAAKNFPHHDRESYRLATFRVAQVGQLLFVHLAHSPTAAEDSETANDVPEPMAQWTQQFAQRTAAQHWRFVLHRELEFDCDWKIPIEGALESYHLAEVHPGTFGEGPDEESTEHLLSVSGTSFETLQRDDSKMARFEENVISMLTGSFDPRYRHVHVFPNLMATLTDTLSLVYQTCPIAPQRCRMTVFGFTPAARQWGILGRGVARWVGWATSYMAMKVLAEDAAIFPEVQSGLNALATAGGCQTPRILGRCEERVHAFQSHWSAHIAQQR
ncbi:aromatic ring-hydroxylating oxygenase subunit alpha [Stieleria varia]|uniref:Benzene 1,2-dioxygenase subunit alpha n=1 Tax=Stieleria varia TaxID=2528005 RepID=A0A5C6B9B7_9BACT|nr:aromatic ring-hydroxylating dioxygenase subunit alpha [Stieleria varia]TWU08317.1 Benzene 1,2-dioxygenase subunit alpha [Stieleria varia]